MIRNHRDNHKKERIVMLASSTLILTALTVTGVVIHGSNKAEKEEYVVDLEALQDSSAKASQNMVTGEDLDTLFADIGSDDLDYDPSFQEANSQKVQNDILTGKGKEGDNNKKDSKERQQENTVNSKDRDPEMQSEGGVKKEVSEGTEEGMFDETLDTAKVEAISNTVQPEPDFKEEDSLTWPIVGDVLINYSMDKTIYFPTLDQYKYNPAIVISANVGENIAAAADGRVTGIGYDSVLGNVVVMDLGNGYELTYGQLDQILVSEGGYVKCGDVIGVVANPTKYYSTEGSNVYFKLTKDGNPINPMTKLN